MSYFEDFSVLDSFLTELQRSPILQALYGMHLHNHQIRRRRRNRSNPIRDRFRIKRTRRAKCERQQAGAGEIQGLAEKRKRQGDLRLSKCRERVHKRILKGQRYDHQRVRADCPGREMNLLRIRSEDAHESLRHNAREYEHKSGKTDAQGEHTPYRLVNALRSGCPVIKADQRLAAACDADHR